MKYCPECGHPIENDLRYCPECGHLLEDLTAEQNGSQEKKYSAAGQKVLIDYYDRVIGTPQEQPYYELVLYTYDGKQLLLEEYPEGDSLCVQSLVPYQAYEEALKVVKNFHLKELLNRKGSPLKGKVYVIRFRERVDDETLYRFSSDNVGQEETMLMFPEMRRVLSSYTKR